MKKLKPVVAIGLVKPTVDRTKFNGARECEVAFDCSINAEQLPHVGRIYLDEVIGGFQLTDMLTQEKYLLRGTWALSFDEDTGTASLHCNPGETGETVHPIDEFLQKDICVVKGSRFLVNSTVSSHQHPLSYDGRLCVFRRCSVSFRLNNVFSEIALSSFVFRHPRDCRQYLYISLGDLYKALHLQCYRGAYSKWVFEQAEAWQKHLAGVTGDHLLFSNHAGAQQRLRCLPKWKRCLPEPAISMIALVRLLIVWSYVVPNQGGFRDEKARRHVADLFGVLVKLAFRGGGVVALLLPPTSSVIFQGPLSAAATCRRRSNAASQMIWSPT